MRLKVSKSKNASSFYVIRSVYNPRTKSNSSQIVEKLGTEVELREKLHGQDPYEWAKAYIEELNRQEKMQNQEVVVKYAPAKIISKNEQRSFNGGYLFLQSIYHQLGLSQICKEISKRYKFDFNLDSVLSRLLYTRVLFPSSKSETNKLANSFIEQPDFDLHHIYRSLDILAKEDDYIQSAVYKNSLNLTKRNTRVLFYDCTNYFFEIEQEEGLKQYGYSKEHRPNPIVQMGLFMDADGIPLAFSIHNGNTNEQVTLKPLEQKILSDFDCSKFIVCTDAGLASLANRRFNTNAERSFITSQSIKKLKKHLREWSLDPNGWRLSTDKETSKDRHNLNDLSDKDDVDKIFYKMRPIKEDGFEQNLIVTYSLKYKNYQRQIRNQQINRAEKIMQTNTTKLKKAHANDYKRFIQKIPITANGEVAKKTLYHLDQSLIAKEEAFDGFYAVCTNLDDSPKEIVKINQRRWEIEECFRIMKHEFKARPVYLRRDQRIKAHFLTCFLSLVLYRLIEKKLDNKYTCCQIIEGLKNMNFYNLKGEGYIPTYTRTDFTDDLHKAFGFRTDYQIVSTKEMKNICKKTKS